FNNNTRSYEDLPAQVESIDWLPSGTQVLYIWLENNKATLNIGDPDTKNWKYIADMWEIDDQINISPDGKNILYFEQNSSSSTNPINLTTPDGKVWKSLVKDGYNSGVLWSPDSQKFLFGKKDPSGEVYQLWYYNLLTSEVKSLNASTTPDKAVWGADSQTVYAAVPQKGVAGGSGLTNDQIYKIDTQSNQNKQYDPGSGLAIDARNLFLDNASSKLFFKNAQDGALYYLDLSASAGQ
ncbi:MAG: hypothetical protein KGJ93_02475, partial [Patescibacteria group bacterium]|nr:hypothetical protein [Patescibacteria group bacterium]